LAGILGGCGAAGDDVSSALPSVATLSIAAPAGAASAPAEPSALWLATRRTADTLNGMIAGVVGQMHAALAGPVTPPLSPLTFRVVAARGADGVAFELEARPRDAGDDAYVPVANGVASDDGQSGEVHIDLATLRGLDPGAPAGGDALAVAYDVAPAETHLALALDEAHYAYVARGTGGELGFDGPDGRIRSGWLASGAGRAVVAGAGGESAPVVVECWNEQFHRVFHAGPDGTDGDPAACADVP
jgi:hypothetical protein